uniref:Uncharacterized protein n=1 Tax=Arundo donax TaxID=35708 RepID=A0A0A9AHD6_ARUDO
MDHELPQLVRRTSAIKRIEDII